MADLHGENWERSRAWRSSGGSRAGEALTEKRNGGQEAELSKADSRAGGGGGWFLMGTVSLCSCMCSSLGLKHPCL